MAAAGTSPALNLREKLAELAGLKQRVSPDLVRCDFGNLVTNGTFDTVTTGWLDGRSSATLSVSSGRLRVTSAAGATVASTFALTGSILGRHYNVSMDGYVGTSTDISLGVDNAAGLTSGSRTFFVAGSAVDASVASQTFTAIAQTMYVGIVAAVSITGDYAELDNVSLYEVDPSDDAPWLRLPYGYKVGKRGMIVRDGVVLHPSDYTKITDSGQTFIKPIVAPGVSTEFSIWAGA